MDPSNNHPNKRNRSSSGYGYGGYGSGGYGSGGYGSGGYGSGGYGSGGYGSGSYGGYGYGYGGGQPGVQMSFRDYVMMLRERLWYVIGMFALIVASTAVYTYVQIPIYQSTSTIQVFRKGLNVLPIQQLINNDLQGNEDLNTQVAILNSDEIVNRVAARLTPKQVEELLAPYRPRNGGPTPSVEHVLKLDRQITGQTGTMLVISRFRHPDPAIARDIANLFADEYIAHNAHLRLDESLRVVDELQEKADEQRKKVDAIANALLAYREKNHLVSLDQRKDISTDKLRTLSNRATDAFISVQAAEGRWKQVSEAQRDGRNLLELSFIAAPTDVSQLVQQVDTQKLQVEQLRQHYRPKHPKMMEAQKMLVEAQLLLQHAVDNATAQVKTAYQSALQDYKQASAALTAQENESLSLDSYGVEYGAMEREYEVNEHLLGQLMQRMQETTVSSGMSDPNAQIVDPATMGVLVFPNFEVNFGLGIIGGLIVGVATAFLLSLIDDRVKSAYDIESIIGLPLIGLIPKFTGVKPLRRKGGAEGTAPAEPSQKPPDTEDENAQQEITEAFATIRSHLQLKDESKAAKCILVTSTLAGEGKSFISRNLALTFAHHGERVVLIDCDMRRPTVHRNFGVENTKGLIDICTNGVPPEDVILKNVEEGVDLIVSGGRTRNASQILNSKTFEMLITTLRTRYDRVLIDTPPVGIVSDALVVLPHVDGAIFTIFFRKVRRKAAQVCVQRLSDVNVPTFGAILNGLDVKAGGYYHHYYGRYYESNAYRRYYSIKKGEKDDRDHGEVRS